MLFLGPQLDRNITQVLALSTVRPHAFDVSGSTHRVRKSQRNTGWANVITTVPRRGRTLPLHSHRWRFVQGDGGHHRLRLPVLPANRASYQGMWSVLRTDPALGSLGDHPTAQSQGRGAFRWACQRVRTGCAAGPGVGLLFGSSPTGHLLRNASDGSPARRTSRADPVNESSAMPICTILSHPGPSSETYHHPCPCG